MQTNDNATVADITILDYSDLERLLPHRQIALMLDSATYHQASKEVIAFKAITSLDDSDSMFHANSTSWMFTGHFPDLPVMPGHFIEEMANLAAATLHACVSDFNKSIIMVRSKTVKHRGSALPNDMLHIHAFNVRKKLGQFICDVTVRNQDGKVITQVTNLLGAISR